MLTNFTSYEVLSLIDDYERFEAVNDFNKMYNKLVNKGDTLVKKYKISWISANNLIKFHIYDYELSKTFILAMLYRNIISEVKCPMIIRHIPAAKRLYYTVIGRKKISKFYDIINFICTINSKEAFNRNIDCEFIRQALSVVTDFNSKDSIKKAINLFNSGFFNEFRFNEFRSPNYILQDLIQEPFYGDKIDSNFACETYIKILEEAYEVLEDCGLL